jgi:hypothetical protein
MGFVRQATGIDLTGGGAVDAAAEAARLQTAAGREGIDVIRGDLAPFREVGTEAANMLMQNIINPQGQDPNDVLNNPFFRSMADQQDNDLLSQRAALGLSGSGGTGDKLQRNLLQLGNQFQQQNISNQQARFQQLFGVAGMGQNAAAQSGSQTAGILGNIANSQSTVPLMQAQVGAQQGQQLMSGLGAGFSGAGGMSGLLSLFGGGATTGGIGAAGAGGGGMGLPSGMSGFSDRRLKKDIKKFGRDESGNIYKFKYIDSNIEYVGRMADELQKVRPDAVSVHKSGYLQVSDEFASRVA